MIGKLGQQGFVQDQGVVVPSGESQTGGGEIAIRRALRVHRQQALNLFQRFGRGLTAKKGHGVAEPRAVVARFALQHVGEQGLGLVQPVLPQKSLGQQLQGGQIVGARFQMRPQQGLRLNRLAGEQGVGGGAQVRIGDRGALVFGEGRLGAADVAVGEQPIAERAPSFGQIGV